jgi:hypothetical protein
VGTIGVRRVVCEVLGGDSDHLVDGKGELMPGTCLLCSAPGWINLGGYCNACARRVDDERAARHAAWVAELEQRLAKPERVTA